VIANLLAIVLGDELANLCLVALTMLQCKCI